jgi:predicted nucleic acid-binding protein
MAHYYFDTSALVKYYLPETGSRWVSSLLDGRDFRGDWIHKAVTTLLSNIEGICALERAHRDRRIDTIALDSARRRLLLDLRSRYRVLGVNKAIVLRAADLAQDHPLRAYDALHVATALFLNEELVGKRIAACVFVSADETLLAAARAEGLTTENPNEHE